MSVQRKDYRECVALGECRPEHRSRKDRRRWCKGREGREHRPVWVRSDALPNAYVPPREYAPDPFGWHYEYLVCQECGKQDLGCRRVCHCGAAMQPRDKRRYYSAACPECGFADYHRRGKRVGADWVYIDPPRPKCRCELGAKDTPLERTP